MPRGGKREGAGRPKGALNKLLHEEAQAVGWKGKTPAEFFSEIMNDDRQPMPLRLEAAKAAAPYVHKKQPEAHEVTDTTVYNGDELITFTRATTQKGSK